MRYIAVYDTGSVTLSTTPTPVPMKPLPVLGHVIGLKISVTASASGTLSSPAPLTAAIQSFNLKDAGQRDILPATIAGSDLVNLEYLLNPKGIAVSVPNVSNSSQTFSFILYLPVAVTAQPAFLSLVLAPYSALASSGATGGSAEVAVAWVVEDRMASQQTTARVFTFAPSLVAGANSLAFYLDRSKRTTLISAVIPDASFSNVTFRSATETEIQNATEADLAAIDNSVTNSGHQSGLQVFRISPFVASDATYFVVTTSAVVNSATFYQIETD